MPATEDDDVIETFAANGSDETLDVRALPRTQRSGDDFLNADRDDTTAKRLAVDAVTISQQPAGRRLVGEGVHDLRCSVALMADCFRACDTRNPAPTSNGDGSRRRR
jgi:hypothetical protein